MSEILSVISNNYGWKDESSLDNYALFRKDNLSYNNEKKNGEFLIKDNNVVGFREKTFEEQIDPNYPLISDIYDYGLERPYMYSYYVTKPDNLDEVKSQKPYDPIIRYQINNDACDLYSQTTIGDQWNSGVATAFPYFASCLTCNPYNGLIAGFIQPTHNILASPDAGNTFVISAYAIRASGDTDTITVRRLCTDVGHVTPYPHAFVTMLKDSNIDFTFGNIVTIKHNFITGCGRHDEYWVEYGNGFHNSIPSGVSFNVEFKLSDGVSVTDNPELLIFEFRGRADGQYLSDREIFSNVNSQNLILRKSITSSKQKLYLKIKQNMHYVIALVRDNGELFVNSSYGGRFTILANKIKVVKNK